MQNKVSAKICWFSVYMYFDRVHRANYKEHVKYFKYKVILNILVLYFMDYKVIY